MRQSQAQVYVCVFVSVCIVYHQLTDHATLEQACGCGSTLCSPGLGALVSVPTRAM